MDSQNSLSEANIKFALDLLEKLMAEDRDGNIFYSPFSIFAAMAMVQLGAAGNTAKQMAEVLHLPEPSLPQPEGNCPQMMSQISQVTTRSQMWTQTRQTLTPHDDQRDVNWKKTFARLLKEMNKPEATFALNVANRLYGEQSFIFKQPFLTDTQKYFHAELKAVDFRSNADASRILINDWVEEQTKGKITDLLPPDSLDRTTKLVLVNAIYFKGKWQAQFKEEETYDQDFMINKDDTKPVKMMTQTSKFPLKSADGMKILELPYKENELSMIIILPDKIEDETTGLEKIEKELDFAKFRELTMNMEKMRVNVHLPRFKMEKSFELKKPLMSMGMMDVFSATQSDLSGMSEAVGLGVSAVVHKAFVEVNEEGTEAAGATGVVVGITSVDPLETFKADHPFLFFIRHNSSNSLLFAGRFTSPE